jgi:hypothetical protein
LSPYFGRSEITKGQELERSKFRPDVPTQDPQQFHRDVATSEQPADTLHTAIEACERTDGSAFFQAQQDQLVRALNAPYTLYEIMLTEGNTAVETVVRQPYFATRKRGPRKDNLALLAILLALKPTTESHRKLCSAWAAILIWAADHEVPASDFKREASQVTLGTCRDHLREKRRALGAKPAADTGDQPFDVPPPLEDLPPIPEHEVKPGPTLELRFRDPAGVENHLAIPVPATAHQELVNVLRAGADNPGETLRKLASVFEQAQAHSTDPWGA